MDDVFVEELTKRTDAIRPTMKLDERMFHKGMRFNNTPSVVELISKAIEAKNDTKASALVSKEMMGLDLDFSQVISGQFDDLIRSTLRQLALMDYDAENSIDFN